MCQQWAFLAKCLVEFSPGVCLTMSRAFLVVALVCEKRIYCHYFPSCITNTYKILQQIIKGLLYTPQLKSSHTKVSRMAEKGRAASENIVWHFFKTPINVHLSLAMNKLLLVGIAGRGKLKWELLARIVEKQLVATEICLGLWKQKGDICQTHVVK